MITRIDDMPSGTIGFRAHGRVTRDDYREVLEPVIAEAVAAGGVRMLYVLGEDFESYSAGAMEADTGLWLGHATAWEKCAVVTDTRWVHDAVVAFGWLMPGRVRTFDLTGIEDAKSWLAEPVA